MSEIIDIEKMSESQFQNEVIKFLKSKGCFVRNNWGGGRFGASGRPDLYAGIDGIWHGIELKTNSGVVKEDQAYELEQMNQGELEGYVLRPTKTKKQRGVFLREYDYYEITFEEWKERWFR